MRGSHRGLFVSYSTDVQIARRCRVETHVVPSSSVIFDGQAGSIGHLRILSAYIWVSEAEIVTAHLYHEAKCQEDRGRSDLHLWLCAAKICCQMIKNVAYLSFAMAVTFSTDVKCV